MERRVHNNTLPPMVEEQKYAWQYFALHSEQRLKTFHFYILFATIISAGIVAVAKETRDISNAVIPSALLCIISFIFWKIDERNRDLIKNGEAALKHIEKKMHVNSEKTDEPQKIQLFMRDDWTVSQKKNTKRNMLNSHLSYTKCFAIIYGCFGMVGLFVMSIGIYSFLSH